MSALAFQAIIDGAVEHFQQSSATKNSKSDSTTRRPINRVAKFWR
ncbi:hypothetical protein ACVIDN_004464 [Rhizobium brockwellii]